MSLEALDDALEVAGRVGYALVATASDDGVPHVAAAGWIGRDEAGRVTVTEWFCPGTVANAAEGKPIAIVAWDPQADEGYQLVGLVEAVSEEGVLDGYEPGLDETVHLPQVRRALHLRVEQVLAFSQAPHTDETLATPG